MRSEGYYVHALSFDYGQRHKKELSYAHNEAKSLDIPHRIVDLRMLGELAPYSALTHGGDVPQGYYAEETMRKTVVPNRNMVMIALATSYAASRGHAVVAYGAHQGDHDVYPDCRPSFVHAMNTAVALCDWTPPRLIVPFLTMDKRGIYAWGLSKGLDYARSWTCYEGGAQPCGRCGACVERLHAFHDIGERDPAEYADRTFWVEAVARHGHEINP
jgi:7-cyano-7-deazaguanine synthase